MSGSNPSINANGVVTITATSPVTQSIISAVFAAVTAPGAGAAYTYSPATSTAAIPTSGDTTLYVTAGTTGSISIPAAYTNILLDVNSSVTVTGGSATATVVGDSFSFNGTAAVVASGDGIASVVDSTSGAQIAFGQASTVTANGTGSNQFIQLGDNGFGTITSSGAATTVLAGVTSTTSIVASGGGDVIDISNGAKTTVSLTGGDTINIGTGAPTSAATLATSVAPVTAPVLVTSVNSLVGMGNTFNIAANQTGFAIANTILQLGTSDTLNAFGGVDTVSAHAADLVNNVSGSVSFVGIGTTSTVFGGTGQTTVFANQGAAGEVFNVGNGTQTGNNNVFIGGAVESTINAGNGGGSFFGGSHGDLYNIGTSQSQVFVGLGGNDTLSGSTGSVAPTIFALNTEHMMLTNTPQVTVVAFEGSGGSTVAGAGGTVDASNTTNNNVFFTGFGSTGNETLIGSLATAGGLHDIFEVGAASMAGAANSTTHANITIDNWHAGDAFYLIGFSAADNQTMDAATTASAQPGAPSGLHFQLSDGTQVTFVGNHPQGTTPTANAIF